MPAPARTSPAKLARAKAKAPAKALSHTAPKHKDPKNLSKHPCKKPRKPLNPHAKMSHTSVLKPQKSPKPPKPSAGESIRLGEMNTLYIARFSRHGAYLVRESNLAPESSLIRESSHAGEANSELDSAPLPASPLYEVLLPKRFLEGARVGECLRVFVYTDSSDRPVATTQQPLAMRGEVAFLKVVGLTEVGVFLDIGLDKDIFLPSKNPARYALGSLVAVYITLDSQQRLIARKNIRDYLLPYRRASSARGRRVAIMPFALSELGVSVVVEGRYYGLIYLPDGLRFQGSGLESSLESRRVLECMGLCLGVGSYAFIHQVRDDGRLDLVLESRLGTSHSVEKVLGALRANGGRLAVHYDSSPESIRALLGMSKKACKRALSELLSRGLITLEVGRGIQLV